MKRDNDYFVSSVCRVRQFVAPSRGRAGWKVKLLSIGDLFHPLIKDIECLNTSVSMRFAICNLKGGVKRGECLFFPILTKKQEMMKRVNHAMKTVRHFVAAQLMSRNHFQRAFALSQGWTNNSPSEMKFSVVTSTGCASKACSALLQSFACTYNKSRNCCRPTRHYPNVSFSKKFCGVCILSTHHKNRYSQCGNRTYGLHPTGPIGLRELIVIAKYDHVDDSKNSQKCDGEVGVFHALAESCLKGILA